MELAEVIMLYWAVTGVGVGMLLKPWVARKVRGEWERATPETEPAIGLERVELETMDMPVASEIELPTFETEDAPF